MPTYDVPTDQGTVRITAGSATEAAQLVSQGKGMALPPNPSGGAPTERPAATTDPALYAQPPAQPDATVYNPGTPPGAPSRDLLQPVYDAVLPAVGRFAGRAALPTAGSLALGVGGQFVPGLSTVPPPVREAAGSMLGTGANMALGIEEPSWQQLLMSGAAPAAIRGTGKVGSMALPGARGARAAGLVEEAKQLPGILERGITGVPGDLYEQARLLNPQVTLGTTGSVAQELLETEAQAVKGTKYGRVKAMATELSDLAQVAKAKEVTEMRLSPILDDAGRPIMREEVLRVIPAKDGTIPLEQLDVVRKRIGALIGTETDPMERAAYKRLYGSLLTDIEQAAQKQGGEGAQALLEGIAQQRRVFAADDLRELISGPAGAISQPRPVDGLQTFNAAKVLKELERPHRGNELLVQFLDQHPDEKQEIVDLLTDMNRRNVKLRPPAGSMFGSGPLVARAGGAAALAKLTGVMDPGTAAGIATVGSELISRALLTPAGRGFLREAMAQGPTINTTQLLFQMVGQGVRGSLGPQPGVTLGLQSPPRAGGTP
jgi:hypothetical protein